MDGRSSIDWLHPLNPAEFLSRHSLGFLDRFYLQLIAKHNQPIQAKDNNALVLLRQHVGLHKLSLAVSNFSGATATEPR